MANSGEITPPRELVDNWLYSDDFPFCTGTHDLLTITRDRLNNVITETSCWASDKELKACCAWLNEQRWTALSIHLRAFRRPKLSLGEQALLEVESYGDCLDSIGIDVVTLRAALRRLTELEALSDD